MAKKKILKKKVDSEWDNDNKKDNINMFGQLGLVSDPQIQ